MDKPEASKALIVYTPPKSTNRFNNLHKYFLKFVELIRAYFLKRRKLLILTMIFFALLYFFGNCFAAHFHNKLPYILDLFFDKYYINTFLISCSIIFASGYTIWGSFLSVCFFALFSFFTGNFIYLFTAYNSINFKFFLCVFSVILLVFFISMFCIDAFEFYIKNKCSSKMLFSKRSCVYIISSLINFNVAFILLTLIIEFFW